MSVYVLGLESDEVVHLGLVVAVGAHARPLSARAHLHVLERLSFSRGAIYALCADLVVSTGHCVVGARDSRRARPARSSGSRGPRKAGPLHAGLPSRRLAVCGRNRRVRSWQRELEGGVDGQVFCPHGRRPRREKTAKLHAFAFLTPECANGLYAQPLTWRRTLLYFALNCSEAAHRHDALMRMLLPRALIARRFDTTQWRS